MPESFNTSTSDKGEATTTDSNSQGTSFSGEDKTSDNEEKVELTSEQIDTLIKRDKNAQEHIKTLETEAKDSKDREDGYKSKLDRASKVEELLNGDKESVSPDDLINDVTNKVAKLFKDQDAAKVADGNWERVTAVLSERFGSKTDDAVKDFCKENDYTWDEAIKLAKNKPNILLKLMGVDSKKVLSGVPTGGSLNSQGFENQNGNQGNEIKGKSIMDMRSDRERVDFFNSKLAAKLK